MKLLAPLCSALLLLFVAVHGQETCGPNYCSSSNQYCCNELCGICANKGDSCSQEFCLSGLFAVCFSGESTLVTPEGPVAMKDVQVGDHILTAGGTYQPLYAFGHRDETTVVEFLKISVHGLDDHQALEVSAKHLVFVQHQREPIPADQVQVGDTLHTLSGDGHVLKIETVIRTGMYAPFTTDGTLVVDGVVASSYVSLPEFQGLPEHTISHLAMAPFRFWCTKVSNKPCRRHREDGIPLYPATLMEWFQWVRLQHPVLQYVVLGAYLAFCCLVYWMELLLSIAGVKWMVAVLVCCVVVVGRSSRASNKANSGCF